MPISVVVGGQYGSEGKGKVALELARRDPNTTIVVRPGGTNSGHTGYSLEGQPNVLRQLPTPAIDGRLRLVFPPGSYIDPEVLRTEILALGLDVRQIAIDPRAHIIRKEHVAWERAAGLSETIGSTQSGTGAAVISRIARYAPNVPMAVPASDTPALTPYLADTAVLLNGALTRGERVVVEGTQGFGLSVLHGDSWPKATSRDTTAAGFLSEAGLSPLHVDDIVMVIRCHPIRVAGDSGPLVAETTWEAIASEAGAPRDLTEFTSVTQKVRRVGHFEAGVVRRAIIANAPTRIVLNHLDYVDWDARSGLTSKAASFVAQVEELIGQGVDYMGCGPAHLEQLHEPFVLRTI